MHTLTTKILQNLLTTLTPPFVNDPPKSFSSRSLLNRRLLLVQNNFIFKGNFIKILSLPQQRWRFFLRLSYFQEKWNQRYVFAKGSPLSVAF
jgi:hypothetical protein